VLDWGGMSRADEIAQEGARSGIGPLLVDDRERSAELWQALIDEGFAVEAARLPAGDLLLPGRWRVERKTVPDFRASLLDGRLFRQAAQLRRHPEAPLFVLEGQRDGVPVLPGELGALLCLILEMDLPVIPSSNAKETARIMGLLARRRRRHTVAIRNAHPRSPGSVAVRLLASIPGIGAIRAQALLESFANLAAVTAAEVNDLETVTGIGPALARRLKKVFCEASPTGRESSRPR